MAPDPRLASILGELKDSHGIRRWKDIIRNRKYRMPMRMKVRVAIGLKAILGRFDLQKTESFLTKEIELRMNGITSHKDRRNRLVLDDVRAIISREFGENAKDILAMLSPPKSRRVTNNDTNNDTPSDGEYDDNNSDDDDDFQEGDTDYVQEGDNDDVQEGEDNSDDVYANRDDDRVHEDGDDNNIHEDEDSKQFTGLVTPTSQKKRKRTSTERGTGQSMEGYGDADDTGISSPEETKRHCNLSIRRSQSVNTTVDEASGSVGGGEPSRHGASPGIMGAQRPWSPSPSTPFLPDGLPTSNPLAPYARMSLPASSSPANSSLLAPLSAFGAAVQSSRPESPLPSSAQRHGTQSSDQRLAKDIKKFISRLQQAALFCETVTQGAIPCDTLRAAIASKNLEINKLNADISNIEADIKTRDDRIGMNVLDIEIWQGTIKRGVQGNPTVWQEAIVVAQKAIAAAQVENRTEKDVTRYLRAQAEEKRTEVKKLMNERDSDERKVKEHEQKMKDQDELRVSIGSFRFPAGLQKTGIDIGDNITEAPA